MVLMGVVLLVLVVGVVPRSVAGGMAPAETKTDVLHNGQLW